MSNFKAEILINGKPIRMFRHKGDLFVEGRKGSTFELKFTNDTWKNVEVVPSVDGLSVLDGEACGETSEGYYVPARQSITVPGWRLNNESVAEFIFKDKKKSYSKQTGQGTLNVGVIGFMVFKEKEYVYHNPYPYSPFGSFTVNHDGPLYSSNTIGGTFAATSNDQNIPLNIRSKGSGSINIQASGASPTITRTESLSSSRRVSKSSKVRIDDANSEETFSIGTGWGDEIGHCVTTVSFERQNPAVADALISVYYDSKKGLEARGIKVVRTKSKKAPDLPNPFPTYTSGCKPPQGWKSSDANWNHLRGPRKRRGR